MGAPVCFSRTCTLRTCLNSFSKYLITATNFPQGLEIADCPKHCVYTSMLISFVQEGRGNHTGGRGIDVHYTNKKGVLVILVGMRLKTTWVTWRAFHQFGLSPSIAEVHNNYPAEQIVFLSGCKVPISRRGHAPVSIAVRWGGKQTNRKVRFKSQRMRNNQKKAQHYLKKGLITSTTTPPTNRQSVITLQD